MHPERNLTNNAVDHPDDVEDVELEDGDDVREPDGVYFNDESDDPLADNVLESLADPDTGEELFSDDREDD
jgi:hypothetical protein